MQKLDWELVLKIIGIAFTAIGGLYQWRNLRFRSKLKDDLEILKLYAAYGTDNPNYIALKKHIDETIAKAYPHPVADEPKKIDRVGIGLGIINLIGGLFFLFLVMAGEVTWFGLLWGITPTIIGLWLLLTSLVKTNAQA